MVFTLHRYIFRELMKVFILALVALTVILSLGSILQPVQEYGVGPRQVVHLMSYFLPITLTFVLPMAALFAAALVYGRFASDNELDACRASGISLPTLLYPGLALAIMVAIANLILSFHVVPYFVHLAEKSLKANAKQILFRNIQRRGYYELPDGRYLIYADLADSQNDMLSGVVVVEMKGRAVTKIITAEKAKVHFDPHEKFNEVQITAINSYQMGPEGSLSLGLSSFTTEFGSLLGDDIKFKNIDEMKKIRDVDPMLFYPIEKLARQTYTQFTTELLAENIAHTIESKAADQSFYKLHSDRMFVVFTAGSCSVPGEKKVELSDDVVVIEYDAATRKELRTLRAGKAILHLEGDELVPTITMELFSPTWQQAGGPQHPAAGRVRIRGLIIPQTVKNITAQFRTENSLNALTLASDSSTLQKKPTSKLESLQKSLQRTIQYTYAEIKAEMHSRLVFGIGCLSTIMIGIGLGIILKRGHLLSAFGISSVPAAALIVCIMMGRNITKNPTAHAGSGIFLMWAGLVLLTLLAAAVYRKLLKN